jgi:hypothetical protein
METTGTNDFFDNWYKDSKHDMRQKIYNYTDNFNPFLFESFKDEYEKYRNGLEIDIKNFSKIDKITGKSPVISLEIDEMGDTKSFVNNKEYAGDLFMPTLRKIFSPNKLCEVIDDLEKKTNPSKGSGTEKKHENIFCNNGFVLFEHILNEYVKTNRGRLSDIHFFYWSLYDNKPQFIHQRPEKFKDWFFENYKEDLGKIKTHKAVFNADRQKHYSNALNWFELQNQ